MLKILHPYVLSNILGHDIFFNFSIHGNSFDCGYRGPKFDPGSVPYFRFILLPLIQEVLLSFISESMYTEYHM